jgi:catechol 2,3-dioxygenase-like lactoylglutathione lyase family enzyme
MRAVIDHIGFPVSDYTRSKAFYVRALAPLGYELVIEVRQHENDSPAAGFGANGKPDFWIGGEGGLNRPMHIAITATSRAEVDAFHRAAIAAGGRDNGAPGLRPQYHPDYYAASSSIPTAITSRRSVTPPFEAPTLEQASSGFSVRYREFDENASQAPRERFIVLKAYWGVPRVRG